MTAGQTVWTEWEHRGTRPDHTAHLMRGVIIFGVRDELIARHASTSNPWTKPVAASMKRYEARPRPGKLRDYEGAGRRRYRAPGDARRQSIGRAGVDVTVLTRDPSRATHLPRRHVKVVRRRRARCGRHHGGSRGCRHRDLGRPRLRRPRRRLARLGRPGRQHQPGRRSICSGADVVLLSVAGASADSPFELFRMKSAAETYLAASRVPATVVRATAFLELWMDLLRDTARRSGRPLVFGRGQNPINFVSVTDVAAVVEHVTLDPTTRGQTLTIGGPDALTLDDLARMVTAADGGSTSPRHLSRPALHVMAATIGRLRQPLGRQARSALAMDTHDMTLDADTARRRLHDIPSTTAADLLTPINSTQGPAAPGPD